MLSRLPRLYQRTRAMSTTANVWVNKDTRCIVQGFTGKQVCHFDLVFLPLLNYIILFNIFIYLICCFFLFFLSSFLPFFLSSFLLFSSFFFLSLSSFHFSHFTLRYCILSALPLFLSFILSFFLCRQRFTRSKRLHTTKILLLVVSHQEKVERKILVFPFLIL